MKILAIESSCDDTAVAVVTSDRQILSNVVISQNDQYQPFCGVVPEIAARSHLQNLDSAMTRALNESQIKLSEFTAIAATAGPGLIGGVLVGAMFAKALATVLKKPFIAINHLEGHALTARLTDNVQYPYLLLLVSGGHCQFVAVLGLGKYKILGQTIDDAAGEAFDKVAKMLNLPFPGGPEVEKRAKFGDPHKYILPKPLVHHADCNLSFSGLKTAVRSLILKLHNIGTQEINDIAASFQYVVGEILSIKMLQAIKKYEELLGYLLAHKTIVIAGGVAANQYLRAILTQQAGQHGYKLIAPPAGLCTDNAAMIAFAGLERLRNNLITPVNFVPRVKWSLEEVC